jgi:hypothetical protein
VHQHALVHIERKAREKGPVREICEGNPLFDSPPQEFVDALPAPRGERPAVGMAALGMLDSRSKEDHLRSLIAGIVRAVTEVHSCPLQGTSAAVDGGAHGLRGHGRRSRVG